MLSPWYGHIVNKIILSGIFKFTVKGLSYYGEFKKGSYLEFDLICAK